MGIVAVLPAVALVIGAAVGVAASLPPACWVALLVLAWCGSVAGLVRRAGRFTVVACVLGFGGAGAALGQRATREALEPPIVAQSQAFRVDVQGNQASPLDVEGVIAGDAAATEFGAAFTIDARRVRLPHGAHGARDPPDPDADVDVDVDGWQRSGGRVRVTVGGVLARERVGAWRAGRRIRAPMLLNAPLPYRNFGTVDQEQRLALAGIRLFGSVKSASLVEVAARGHWWQEGSAAARDIVRRVVARFVGRWHARSGAIVTAILIGDRAGLDAETESRLQRAGTYHVIAISGGNIAILVTLATVLLRLAGAPPRTRAWLAIGMVVIYAAVVGSGASVARATLGAVIYLFARALDHRSAAINILAVACALMLAIAPLEVLDPAFWLTCVATLAILVCAQRIQTQLTACVARVWARLAQPQPRPLPQPQPGESRGARESHASHPSDASHGSHSLHVSHVSHVSRALHGAHEARGPRWIEPALALLAATIAAESWLLPITAYAFSQATAAGLALNFVAIPLMTIAQIGGLVVLATAGWMTPLASSAGYVAHLAAYGLVESARLVDVFPHAALRVAPPPLWVVIIAECTGGALWLVRLRWQRLAAVAVWMASLATIALAPPWLPAPAMTQALHAAGHDPCAPPALPARLTLPAQPAPPRPVRSPGEFDERMRSDSPSAQTSSPSKRASWLRMTTLDVAQGDATLVRFPNGAKLLIDAGGSVTGTYDVGARIVSPALWALGLRRMDTLVLTHGDRDHIGGASAILGDFTPREVWEGVPVKGHELLDALHRQASARSARWRSIRLGEQQQQDGAILRVWNPPPPDWERRRVRNDDSIVLEITFGRISIVLPGDIGPAVERQLASDLPPSSLRILKAAHHGSGQSSTATFLTALAPRVAIISAGRGNRFGHPAPAALARYRTQDTAIFRTDQDGAIEVDTDGEAVFITTCSGRTLHLAAPE
jgi:competence protein ComEC